MNAPFANIEEDLQYIEECLKNINSKNIITQEELSNIKHYSRLSRYLTLIDPYIPSTNLFNFSFGPKNNKDEALDYLNKVKALVKAHSKANKIDDEFLFNSLKNVMLASGKSDEKAQEMIDRFTTYTEQKRAEEFDFNNDLEL